MSVYSLETANDMLQIWLECEKQIALNQSYEVNGKSFTKANASHIREQISFWETQVLRIKKAQRTGKPVRSGPTMKSVRFIDG